VQELSETSREEEGDSGFRGRNDFKLNSEKV
jgi:hypothetical protein